MSFTGLFNRTPPKEESQHEIGENGENGHNGDNNGRVNLFPSQICSGVSTGQVMGVPDVPTPQGVQRDVGHDMLSGARKRPRDLSFGQMSNYDGFGTSSSGGDKITMMIRQQQIETVRLIDENTRKLRMELTGGQAQQAKHLVTAVREENLGKLRVKDDEIWRMEKNNYFLQQKVKSLIDQNRSLMNSVITHQANTASLQAELIESERRLLEANVIAEGAESCCGSNNIHVDLVDYVNAASIDQDGYDVRNDCYVMNQGGYVSGDGGYNMDQSGFIVGDADYIIDWNLYGEDGVGGGIGVGDGDGFGGGIGVGDGDGVGGGAGGGYLPDKYKCKSCGEREASVLVLPCRHLCLCSVCETSLRSTCPVCEVYMESNFHVNSS